MTIIVEKEIAVALLRVLDKGLKTLTSFSLILGGMLLGFLMFSYVFEVVARYFFDSPTSWVFDLGRALLCISLVLALPDITRRQGHITIDAVLEKMSPKKRNRMSQFISLLCFAICMVSAWFCLDETIRQFQNNIDTYWINPIPKWWISSFIPFGFALSGLHFLKLGLQRQDSKPV